jgi:hypothetical protein
MRKQRLTRMVRSKRHQKYWGVLARAAAYKAFHKPDNFMSLLQEQYHNAAVPGKDKPDQQSEDTTI